MKIDITKFVTRIRKKLVGKYAFREITLERGQSKSKTWSATCFEGKSHCKDNITVSIDKNQIQFTLVDRGGIKEGWEIKRWSCSEYGVREVLRRVILTRPHGAGKL